MTYKTIHPVRLKTCIHISSKSIFRSNTYKLLIECSQCYCRLRELSVLMSYMVCAFLCSILYIHTHLYIYIHKASLFAVKNNSMFVVNFLAFNFADVSVITNELGDNLINNHFAIRNQYIYK